jgi:hypothetical protein
MYTIPPTTPTKSVARTKSLSTPIVPPVEPSSTPPSRIMGSRSCQPAPGIRARMPAMINRLMPLPMPYSSICSPSHIKKVVPAVMVKMAVNCQPRESRPVSGFRKDSRIRLSPEASAVTRSRR